MQNARQVKTGSFMLESFKLHIPLSIANIIWKISWEYFGGKDAWDITKSMTKWGLLGGGSSPDRLQIFTNFLYKENRVCLVSHNLSKFCMGK